MSAIFNFESLLMVLLLLICTCAYIRAFATTTFDRQRNSYGSLLWKAARIGERLSPWVALCCFTMAGYILFLI